MITVQMAEKIAEMAKIGIRESELERTREELAKMIRFAREIQEVADSITEDIQDSPANTERMGSRPGWDISSENLAEYGMHIRDGFFRIEAGRRK